MPIRVAVIRENHTCWQGRGDPGTLAHCRRECQMVQPRWKTLWWRLKKLSIELS